jgi:hypothetical protein
MKAATLPPLDPEVLNTADAEERRRAQFTKKALAEGRLKIIKNEQRHQSAQGNHGSEPPR